MPSDVTDLLLAAADQGHGEADAVARRTACTRCMRLLHSDPRKGVRSLVEADYFLLDVIWCSFFARGIQCRKPGIQRRWIGALFRCSCCIVVCWSTSFWRSSRPASNMPTPISNCWHIGRGRRSSITLQHVLVICSTFINTSWMVSLTENGDILTGKKWIFTKAVANLCKKNEFLRKQLQIY